MRRPALGRVLTWIALALFLAAVVMALVIVWTANERVWYLDAGGADATLDMSLTATARWIATGVLIALIGLGVGALLLGFRTPRGARDAATDMPLTGRTFTYVEQTPAPARPAEETAPAGAYHSTIVGDTETRRAEESLPPTVALRREVAEAISAPDATASEPDVTRRIAPPPPDEPAPDDRTRIVFRRRAGGRREAGRAGADRGE